MAKSGADETSSQRSPGKSIFAIIRRTLIYGTLTAMLAGVYFGSVLLLQRLWALITGQVQTEVATVLSTLAIAALFVPLRGRVQGAIDRWFYRQKYDAVRTVIEFGTAVRDDVDLGKLSEDLMPVVQATMQPAHVSLWLSVMPRYESLRGIRG